MATGFPAHLQNQSPRKKIRKLVEKKDYFAGWFCGGFYNAERLCSESQGAVLNQAEGWQRVGTEGTDTIMHREVGGRQGEKTTVPFFRKLQLFLLHKTPSLPHWYEGRRKGFKLKALKSKQDVWAREKEAILNPCEDPKRIKIWRLGAFHWIIACTALSSQYLCLHPPLQSHTSSSP